jgi:hypothetical protein
MKRRLIYGLVLVALLLNLAIGARIYLGSARARREQDTGRIWSCSPTCWKKSARNTWTART